LGVVGDLIAFGGSVGKRGGQQIDGAGHFGAGDAAGQTAVAVRDRGGQDGGLVAGILAFFHGAAQCRLHDLDPGFHFAAAILGSQQFGLHHRNLPQCRTEPLLGRDRLVGAVVAFCGNRVQPVFIDELVALRLCAEIAGTDTVHQQNRSGDDRPADHQGRPGPDHQLGFGFEPDKPGFGVRTQEQTLFGKAAFKGRVDLRR
jgi:hypothetical protein